MKSAEYDIVVVGAGAAGFAAARTARALGASVALTDPGPLGGLCILAGCMPSKTLIATSDLAQAIREAGTLGIRASDPRVDLPAVIARKREIIRGFADFRIDGIKTFPIYEGRARFLNEREVQVGDTVLRGGAFLISTGSLVAPAPVPGLADAGFIDSDAALELSAPPGSLIVLGGGYVGAELGQYFARIGVPTTFVVRAKHLLSVEDADIGEELTAYFREEGIDVRTETQIERVTMHGAKKVVHFRDGGSVEADEILYALGRVANIEGLDLELAGVRAHPITGVEIDATMRTSNPAIFAAGDVTGKYPLVHVAIYQGEIAARNALLGTNERADYSLIKARTIFCDPQVAVAGETEKELRASDIDYVAASYPFADHGKAIAVGKTKGFVKMLASPRGGKILGVAILGPGASDLVHEAIVALRYGSTVHEFAKIPHLHPTMAEILTNPAEELAARIDAAAAVGAQ